MIVDLHAHYAMHLDPGIRGNVLALKRSDRTDLRWRDYLRALGVNLASQFLNYPSLFSGPRIRAEWMAEGRVGVALSPLYSFFDEAECRAASGTDNLEVLLRQATLVEDHIADKHSAIAEVVHNPSQLSAAMAAKKVALVHAVEGGFHLLGDDPADVRSAVNRLADRGVAYITLAHLIWRGIATGANAFPQLSDAQYARYCKQPPVGLTSRGRAAVEAMVDRHVLIDVSHMSTRAIDDTFRFLDELGAHVPVVATHSGYRIGSLEYNLEPRNVERIAASGGFVGLIFAKHQLCDGLEGAGGKGIEGAVDVMSEHIERIRDVTGGFDHIALGSDFDGFIRPLDGLRDMRDMRPLQDELERRYPGQGEQICSGNALRPLLSYWRGHP